MMLLALVKVYFVLGPDCCEGVDTGGDLAQQTDTILREGNQGMWHREHVLSGCQGTGISRENAGKFIINTQTQTQEK